MAIQTINGKPVHPAMPRLVREARAASSVAASSWPWQPRSA